MTSELSLKEIQKEWHGTLKAYAIGFILSIILTVISFSLVLMKLLSGHLLVYTIIGLALTQAMIQLLFFLHVGQEAKPRWETIAFGFMTMVLLIIMIGSLWIMNDLDDRMMTDMNANTPSKQAEEVVHD